MLRMRQGRRREKRENENKNAHLRNHGPEQINNQFATEMLR
jgi:hypothetical protein